MSETTNYFLPKNRYQELKYFCLQYKYYTKIIEDVASTPERKFLAKNYIMLIKAAVAIAVAEYEFNNDILFDCVTNGLSFKRLVEKYGDSMPAKETFYEAYRRFFYHLNQNKGI